MIVESIMNEWQFATLRDTDEVLYWKNGNYVFGGETIIKEEMFKQFGYGPELRHKREVLDFIKQQTYVNIEDFDLDLDTINIGDGLYHISNDTVTPHDPNYLTMIQNSDILYSLKAPPKYYIKECVNKTFYPDDIQVAIDCQAYTFYRSNPIENITVLVGDGLNGKSVFMSPLKKAHGKKNVSKIRYSKLIDPEDRFSLAQLEGKAYNYDGEMSPGFIEDAASIKLLTGNDELSIERKNKDPRLVRIYAKIFNSANSLPESADKSGGYYRRQTVLGLPRTFEEGGKDTDPYLEAKSTTQEEVSDIFFFQWMPALRRILKEKKLTKNEILMEDIQKHYEMIMDPIRAFKQECLMDGSSVDSIITKEDLYQTYLVFCNQNRLQIISKEKFGRVFKKLIGSSADWRDEWRGVRLIPKEEMA